MFEYPLIRFDNRIWLEKMQDGEFFMRNCFFYQKTECDDSARSDPYDGCIPLPEANGFMKDLSKRNVRNTRLAVFNRFIKCFYHCTKEDFTLIGNNLWKLKISTAAEKMVNGFGVDSALIVFNPSGLVEQIENACKRENKRAWFGDVQYIEQDDYCEIKRYFAENPRELDKIPFCKNAKYRRQKEYRICIENSFDINNETSTWFDLSLTLADQSYTISIGRIEDSCIVSLENLFNNGILYDMKEDHYYVCEESKNA